MICIHLYKARAEHTGSTKSVWLSPSSSHQAFTATFWARCYRFLSADKETEEARRGVTRPPVPQLRACEYSLHEATGKMFTESSPHARCCAQPSRCLSHASASASYEAEAISDASMTDMGRERHSEQESPAQQHVGAWEKS